MTFTRASDFAGDMLECSVFQGWADCSWFGPPVTSSDHSTKTIPCLSGGLPDFPGRTISSCLPSSTPWRCPRIPVPLQASFPSLSGLLVLCSTFYTFYFLWICPSILQKFNSQPGQRLHGSQTAADGLQLLKDHCCVQRGLRAMCYQLRFIFNVDCLSDFFWRA